MSHRSRSAATILVLAFVLAACTPPPDGGGTPLNQCPTVAGGQVRVAVVVDAAELGGQTNVVCVVVPAGSNGVQVLAARATRLGQPAPRYNNVGLLCAIDGIPVAPACGNVGPNGPEYWSYWLGGASWQFAPIGPASRIAADGTVDGWRFTPGGIAIEPPTTSQFSQLVT